MLNRALKLVCFSLSALIFASVPAHAVDEYGVRCNPGGGQLPRDGVICFAFRPGTKASDFGDYRGQGHAKGAYVAANGRGMAVDCPNKDPRTDDDDDVTLVRKVSDTESHSWLILKGQEQSGKHRCCVAQWQNGNGQLQKWCPDMPPLQV